jgi:TPR repeat protein
MKSSNVGGSLVLAGLVAAMIAAPLSAAEEITQCDVLVSHPLDPDRITDGVSSVNVLHEEGIAACLAAVTRDPENPRLNFQLGRVYFYDGQTEKALSHLEQAADAGYRQAQFVLGYVLDSGLGGADKEPCRTEDLWLRAARSGRLAALVSYPHHVMRGGFNNCRVQTGDAEMMTFLEQAKARELDYYQTVLVDDLVEDLSARMAAIGEDE